MFACPLKMPNYNSVKSKLFVDDFWPTPNCNVHIVSSFPYPWVKKSNFNLCAKPQLSLTAPNHDHFVQVSLTVLDFFGCNCQS